MKVMALFQYEVIIFALSNHSNLSLMNVTAHIDVSTPKGRKIVRELEKNKEFVEIDYPIPVSEDGSPIKTFSAEYAENLLWEKLNELYGTDIHEL